MKEKLIVGFGEALWDMLPEGRKIGGAPANFAYHVSQFGFSSCVVSAVGNDPLGDGIVADFEAKGLRSVVERVQFPTGTVEIELDSAGVPRYDIKEGAAWDNIPYTARLEELAASTKAVCFGSLVQRTEVSRGTLAKFLDAMPQDGSALVVFDINMRQNFYSREVVCESLSRCNILKLNDEELELITPMLGLPGDSVEERCRAIIGEYGLKMLVLTCGVNGSYVFSADAQSFLPTPKVEVADTVGAGDSFTATFVASLLRGFDMAGAHRRAVAVSAFVCSQKGAMPVLPDEYKL